MNKVIQGLVLVPGLGFVAMGFCWLLAPAAAAPMFGLTLGEGVALSSQVGDMTGFFLTLGCSMLLALYTGRKIWYYPAIMLLAITAFGRIAAWLLHDATLALDLILPEVVIAILLLVAARKLATSD